MNLKYGKQIEIEEIKGKEIDIFLFAKNHEKRVFTAFDKISKNSKIFKTIAFCYDQPSTKIKERRNINTIHVQNHQEISALLDVEFSDIQTDSVTILVDYSCMTKAWYYTIILYLKKKNLNLQFATIYFVYTPSKFTEPKDPKPNIEIAPLPGKYFVPTDKPKALIVCLGYENKKAEGIIEHLDPKECYLMYTNPALDENFVEEIVKNNAAILENTNKIITFPLDDLITIERELTSLYYLLKEEYSIIIAPLGPKPFTFISMLMSIKFKDIDIWRVGSGSDINEYLREPLENETFIISKVVFEKNKQTSLI